MFDIVEVADEYRVSKSLLLCPFIIFISDFAPTGASKHEENSVVNIGSCWLGRTCSSLARFTELVSPSILFKSCCRLTARKFLLLFYIKVKIHNGY